MQRKFLCSFLFLIFASVSFCDGQTQRPLAFDSTKATAIVEEYMKRNSVPGAVAVITNGPRIIYSHGFGFDGEHHAITPETLLPIASLSKSFTAMAVMELVEAGKISLEHPVVEYLPEFKLADERYRLITVGQLLSHTSGMSDRKFREKSVEPVPGDLRAAVVSLHTARLASQPGSRRSYHNPNYWVAARLVEVVSGQGYGDYLRERVLKPAGMARSYVANAVPDTLGRGYTRVLSYPLARKEPAWFLGGCCDVITSAEDMGHWLMAQNSKTDGLVSSESMMRMHGGMGWSRTVEDGYQTTGHNGILFTHTSQQYLLPEIGEGVGIAAIANTGIGLAALDGEEIARLLRKLIEGKNVEQPVPTDRIVTAVFLLLIGLTLIWVVRALKSKRPSSKLRITSSVTSCVFVLLWLVNYPAVLRFTLSRDLNWEQCIYATSSLLLWVVVLAIGSTAVTIRRLMR